MPNVGFLVGEAFRKSNEERCPRCGLKYHRDNEKCPHCSHLSDLDAKLLGDRYKSSISNESSKLGKLFFLLFVISVGIFACIVFIT